MTPDSLRYSDPTYQNSHGQYGPTDSYREPAEPIYCKECGDFRVNCRGDVCTFCTICAVRGETAAEAWWLAQHGKTVIA